MNKPECNAIGIPFEKCHCFDRVTYFCHYCLMSLREYKDTEQWCNRTMEPIDGHQNYLRGILGITE